MFGSKGVCPIPFPLFDGLLWLPSLTLRFLSLSLFLTAVTMRARPGPWLGGVDGATTRTRHHHGGWKCADLPFPPPPPPRQSALPPYTPLPCCQATRAVPAARARPCLLRPCPMSSVPCPPQSSDNVYFANISYPARSLRNTGGCSRASPNADVLTRPPLHAHAHAHRGKGYIEPPRSLPSPLTLPHHRPEQAGVRSYSGASSSASRAAAWCFFIPRGVRALLTDHARCSHP